ncbi:hypothetical protein F8S09_16310 [Deinococcus sp. SDU3-2]|uniref:Uncharacterized protein n=1 Tax=Deinococcus terrestris TaxID=2651870 RepID=A0A7X1NYM8_9DEIO|nr:hypothetical protein [Deinococcus terrestris]MPY68220.1 hypothetical protein [Deinococcus terrestris]
MTILLVAASLSACGNDEPNDANIDQAVRARMGGKPKAICVPEYVKLDEPFRAPVDDRTAQDVEDLAALGLVEVEQGSDVFTLQARPKAQPYIEHGQLCLARYSYGKLKSLADRQVNSGGLKTLVAHITPVVEPMPGVPPHWVERISSIQGIRGMTAEMVQTKEGWRAVSESLY